MVEKNKGLQGAIHIFFILLTLLCVVPFLLLIIASITSESALIHDGYSFFPKEFSADAYRFLLLDSGSIVKGYGISALVTVVGTLCNMTLTTLLAYPLSRQNLPGRNIIAFVVFFTMLFNGGLVPSYMMWTQIFHIKNTIAALLVPNLMLSAFNVIMMRSYFTSNIPDAVIDAARIDGASEIRTLIQVVLPMSVPILATLALLAGLGYWNDWLNGLYYISDNNLYSIQVLLYQMLTKADFLKSSAASALPVNISLPSTGIRMAVAVLGTVPMLLVYPFFQRYLVRGIVIGAVKG
ncbi:MAG: carbohydrate ABC transporter permease [Gemmiger sp.]|nr:carbohydrate ABC transporter permease [Gemmiger sp.]